jgi:hypothetical protein
MILKFGQGLTYLVYQAGRIKKSETQFLVLHSYPQIYPRLIGSDPFFKRCRSQFFASLGSYWPFQVFGDGFVDQGVEVGKVHAVEAVEVAGVVLTEPPVPVAPLCYVHLLPCFV